MRLNIDFTGRGRGKADFFLFTLSVAISVVVAWEGMATYLAYQQSAQALASARHQGKRSVSPIPTQRVDAVNLAIQQLNLPWQELFTAIEGNLTDQVALLSLEPDAASRILRIQAEAKSPEDLMDFAESLEGEDAFLSVALTRHEINDSDRNRPYRFTLEATWRAEY